MRHEVKAVCFITWKIFQLENAKKWGVEQESHGAHGQQQQLQIQLCPPVALRATDLPREAEE